MPQIILEDVVKTYRVALRGEGVKSALRGAFSRERKIVRAVDGIGFSMEAGELAGYIGPNGAGKSTTVKLMGGILVPDSGRIEILGRVPHRDRKEHVARIGVVFGQRSQLWWDTPVGDSFDLLRDIYRVPEADYRRRRGELTERLGAGDLLRIPVRQLSLGQRMRCELIAALLHAPDILFLDEPTIGLDAVAKLALRKFLTEIHRERGVTMILTSHDMDDVEALCDRVIVIGRGAILFDGGIGALRARFAPERVLKLRFRGPAERIGISGAKIVEWGGTEARVEFDPAEIPAERLIADVAARCSIADLTVEAPGIEGIVAKMYAELKL